MLFHCVFFANGTITTISNFSFFVDKTKLVGVESLPSYARRLFPAVRDKNLDCLVNLVIGAGDCLAVCVVLFILRIFHDFSCHGIHLSDKGAVVMTAPILIIGTT